MSPQQNSQSHGKQAELTPEEKELLKKQGQQVPQVPKLPKQGKQNKQAKEGEWEMSATNIRRVTRS